MKVAASQWRSAVRDSRYSADHATRRRRAAANMNIIWILAAMGATLCEGAIVPPPWADPGNNPCASRPGGWQLLYWPGDGKCYKIFTKGPPCPVSMELTLGPDRRALCRCPPGTALHKGDNLCHPLFSTSPCPPQHYFAPLTQSSSNERWGVCEPVAPCPNPGELFHPRDTRCYPSYTQGPCPRGQLLAPGSPNSTLGQCRCDQDGRLGRYYWHVTGTCHQHWTPGPCQEKGNLFLPEGKCGCHPGLPHYHPPTRQCYQIGTVGPCPAGHHFVVPEAASDAFTDPAHAQCQCKEGHVRWDKDGVCYRPFTRGPCPQGQMFSVNTLEGNPNVTAACVAVPCPPGRLWFPGVSGCHRVGSQGPCPPGQVVLFQDSVRTSVEGVSYQGMCGCATRAHDDRSFYPTLRADERGAQYGRCGAQSRKEDNRVDPDPTSPGLEDNRKKCAGKRGFVQWTDGSCQQLYSRGPCPAGQWLVPAKGQRQGRVEGTSGGRCECLPSFTPSVDPMTRELICHPPSVTIARYLNKLAAEAA